MKKPHRRSLLMATAGLILAFLLLSLLIAGGRFDPRSPGELQLETPPQMIVLRAGESKVSRLLGAELIGVTRVELVVSYLDGDQDMGYGLTFGDTSGQTTIALSPAGYVALWNREAGSKKTSNYVLPWQTWPHVLTGISANKIWLDTEGQNTSIRINGELLWQGQLPFRPEQAGIWSESFGEASKIAVTSLRVFSTSQVIPQ